MKKLMVFVAVVTIVAVGLTAFTPAGVVSAAAIERGGPDGRSNGQGISRGTQGGGIALIPLTAEEQDALQQAILEEYGALNLYNAVVAQLGGVYPFSQIALSEQQHVNVLVRQAEKYGVDVPANPGLAASPSFTTVAVACQAGVAAEIADAALYDELELVTTHTDLLQVYARLQSASLNTHLLAFQTCD